MPKSSPDSTAVFRADELPLDAIGPERVFALYDPRTGMRAVVVVDTTRFGVAGGGVRAAPDVSLRETARLARGMTLKYALCGLPSGGAKAGVMCDPSAPDRAQVMAAFVSAIRPLTEAGLFMPGPDMGTRFEDFAALYGDRTPLGALGDQVYEGMPLEDQLTGYGVVMAARAASVWAGGSLAGARVALEGFGKVGAGATKFFAREGARLVAVSNVGGALHEPGGLDTERLLALRARHGDDALARYAADTPAAKLLPREALFTVPADVLVPGARPDVIRPDNAGAIGAKLVVPAANIPYAEGAIDALAARGVTALPDFVTNAGGVMAVIASLEGRDARGAFDRVREHMESAVPRVLDAARARETTAYAAAVALAGEVLGG